jgi:hypothetical protein
MFRSRFVKAIAIRGISMELYLQFGYGMMEHCRSLIRDWEGGSVILSPRDLNSKQLQSLPSEICDAGGSVLLDPQFYLPYADHERLVSHDYWPNEYESGGFWTGHEVGSLLKKLQKLNGELGCSHLILPGVHAAAVDDDWLMRQQTIIDEAVRLGIEEPTMIVTVALSADAVKNIQQIHTLLEAARTWSVGSVYLVCEHPKDYLVDDPIWVSNTIEVCAGFRLQGKRVILGYCNHQMLIAASASANAIASGTWMNVRSFPPAKFRTQYEEDIKKRTTWYYCPQALSEFKIPFLDVALQQGVLNRMVPDPSLGSSHADILFQGPQPSTVDFTEKAAFRHYLQCLRIQVSRARHSTFDDTVAEHERQLAVANDLLTDLHSRGVSGGNRDFKECIEANTAAIRVLQTNRSPMLRRKWAELA